MPDKEIKQLIEKWEEIYKRGLLSFWLLLLLSERPYYPYEIGDALREVSQGSITADKNSIYRALSRFEELQIVSSEIKASDTGPARRYYHLTPKGQQLLSEFIRRNILVFGASPVKNRIATIISGDSEEEV